MDDEPRNQPTYQPSTDVSADPPPQPTFDESEQPDDEHDAQPVQDRAQSRSLGRDVAAVALAIAVLGVALGLTPLVYGAVIDESVLYGTEERIEEQQNPFENEPPQERQEKREAMTERTQAAIIIGITGQPYIYGDIGALRSVGLAPYMAVLVSGIVGALAAVQHSRGRRSLLLVAGGGTLIGAFLFVVASTILAAATWPSIDESGHAVIAAVQYGSLVINAIAIAVVGAVAGVGSAVFVDALDR